ncbi:DUF1420 family protein [Dyadobacter psychrophilus]|uniref:Glycosyltransferase RgtA/B/C/D-like domain-containing protein n=1 Tax=Dyadobacter psychrophilus TaxID=651661 RepID=A0A1T5EBU0_9BACT|nr:DUF1420 family protein [Dyadobacter psychrophilus]SKB81462.1 Protein of unknown function [Dyadobacter psychrophilus]
MNSLSAFFISSPLSVLLTLSVGISLAMISDDIGKRFFKNTEPVQSALYFFAGLLALSWLIWLIGLFGLLSVLLLKVIFWGIILCGTFIAVRRRGELLNGAKRKLAALKALQPFEFFTACVLIIILGSYFLLSLTVPTDSDSLNYHLALPVEILQKGSLWFNRDHLHYRLAGFGEMINLLGVANGCPQLGAFIQTIALLHTLRALSARVMPAHKLTICVFLAGIPTLLFLLPNQKHQLTGILCTTVCFLFISNSPNMTLARARLVMLAMLFAAGLKYSFLISVAALSILFLMKRSKNISLSEAAANFALLTLFVLGPQLIFRWMHFSDPLSPLLEGLLAEPDPVVQKFHHYIKNFRESSFPFPANMLLTDSPGKVSTILGSGAIIFGFLPFLFRKARAEITSIIFLLLAICIGSQLSSRFLMEPLLWTLPLFITAYGHAETFKYFGWLLRAQMLCIVPFVALGLYALAPSLFSDALRTKVLINSANGYAESAWLNQQLPAHAHIATSSRSRAFLPRPFFPWEYLVFTSLEKPSEVQALRKKLAEYQIDHIVLPENGTAPLRAAAHAAFTTASKTLPLATRNPLNRTNYQISIFKIDTLTMPK